VTGSDPDRQPIVVAPEEWGPEPVRLIHWLVDPGETIDAGEVLAEIGRPGIVGDLRARRSGRVAELSRIDGESVLPGAVLGWIESPATEPAA
jgi:pyruvate/2-oxoglutarate dehydrogenase complex dihydrolipoamide acyltransferase (E2) component